MDFIAKRNTITPATSKEAPANKLKSKLERPYQLNIVSPKNAIEINISRRWALRMIRIRIELDCILITCPTMMWPRGRGATPVCLDVALGISIAIIVAVLLLIFSSSGPPR